MKFEIDVYAEPKPDKVHINTKQDIIDWQCTPCYRNKAGSNITNLPACFALAKDKNHCRNYILK